ncbi:mediator complex subunit med11, partial [Cystoisospora suis]
MATSSAGPPPGEAKEGREAMNELTAMVREVEQQQEAIAHQIAKVVSKIRTSNLNVKRNEAALQLLDEAGPDCVSYRQISRVFVLTPPAKLKTQLQSENEGLKEEAVKLESLKEQLMVRSKSVDAQAAELQKT